MYSTCISCHSRFQANDVVRALPIGRRMAFDPAKGRLWLVCDRCASWNLVPLEERWEATEECERLFRGTSLKVSRESITLAHVPAGLTLVRVGKANPFELAAWRYGRLLRRRRREMSLLVTTSSIVGVGIAVGWLQYGFLSAAMLQAGAYLYMVGTLARQERRVLARVGTGTAGATRSVRLQDAKRMRLDAGPDGWRLELPAATPLDGDVAMQTARLLLPWLNRGGASLSEVAEATGRLEQMTAAAPERRQIRGKTLPAVSAMSRPQKLALEMAANEDIERRAAAGELALLEAAWREAEEIAAIADDLLLPDFIRDRLRRSA
jgi:hypothetical protein